MSKVIPIRRNPETAAATDWRAVEEPLVFLVLATKHLCCETATDAVLVALAKIANHAANGHNLNKQMLQEGYNPVVDDSIAALAGKVLGVLPDLVGGVPQEYVRSMAASCDNLLLACSHRRASRQPAQAQRMERAA